ncbi:Cof-type HAD-IIB family hydrolase [Enterococcus sp. AZ163]|uniref:Cof-type HAD-IIB family hydrolase n=1 Tax=Enterococcus sp. AZ163 TaxID=2774638 RepID=UPI003D2D846C
MIKGIVFFDLDGTLLDKRSHLNTANREALFKLTENGYLPVVVTGRAPWEIRELTAGGDIHSYIGLNGQIVFNQKIVYQSTIEKEIIEEVVLLSNRLNHPLAFYGKETSKITAIDEAAVRLYQLDNAALPEIMPTFYRKEDILMLYLFSKDEEKDQLYQTLFGNYLTIIRDTPFSVAMTAIGNSKKTGIKNLMNSLSLKENVPTYAFGDGNNDLPMFEAVDYRIAMGNGTDKIKKAADFVTKSNEDGGIIHGLHHLNLI